MIKDGECVLQVIGVICADKGGGDLEIREVPFECDAGQETAVSDVCFFAHLEEAAFLEDFSGDDAHVLGLCNGENGLARGVVGKAEVHSKGVEAFGIDL